ncbi:MAG: hypothetical protein CR972_00475 [Candidatus Moraniibacteriota bacterium]|nr:MAG: hypothetical protein CR972_00475 [Candidatus Moranbacteria bacterium]
MDQFHRKMGTQQPRGSQQRPVYRQQNMTSNRSMSGNVQVGRVTSKPVNQQRVVQSVQNGQQKRVQKKENFTTSTTMISILDKISAVCIFLLFFGLPLFFLNLTYQGIGFEKQYYFYFWTFLGVIALITQGMLEGKIDIRRTALDIPLVVLWVVCFASMMFSVDRYHSFFGFFGNPVNGFMSLTAAILAYYLIVSYTLKKRVNLIWWAITFSGSIVVIWSFFATMRFVPTNILQYISPSLTGSFTSLAIFIGMMLPVFIVSFSILDQSKGKSFKRSVLMGIFFLMIILDMFTLSILHGYVQWYIILFAIFLLLVFTISQIIKVSSKTSSMIIFVFLSMFILWMWGQPIISVKPIQSETSINYSLSFDIAKEAIKNKPIFGSGPGTYGYNFSLHRPKDLNKSGQYDIRFYSDRGVFMESISTIGLAGMIALVIVVLTYVSTVVLSFIRSQDDDVNVVSLGLFIASVVAIIYGMFWAVDGMIILYGLLISALTIGLLCSSSDDSDEKFTLSVKTSPQYALSFAFLSILVALGMIFGFVTLGKMFIADIHAGNALKARTEGDFVKSSDFFHKAVNFNEKEGRYFTVIGQYGLDLANVELAKPEEERNDEIVAQYISGATGATTSGKDRMPNDVLANETKGFVYENSGGFVSGALSTAMNSYERASELEPYNPYLDVAVGKLKLIEAQTKGEDAVEEKKTLVNEAKTSFEAAKEKTTFDYDGQEISLFAPAHYYISVVEEALGNIDASIEAMTSAVQVMQLTGGNTEEVLSRQINYGFNLARLLQVRGTEDDMKNAENLLLQIIGINDQEVNSHLSLGLLYEKQGKRDEAVSEYQKIIKILPQEDLKAQENIQSLIDTVEQGGSNVDVSSQNNAEESSVNDDDQEEADAEKENVNMIIIKRGDVGDRAERGRKALSAQGFDSKIREEGDAKFEGVTVMYGSQSNHNERQRIIRVLENEFSEIDVERNDEEVGIYNHDIVVVIGVEKGSKNDNESEEEESEE